MIDSHAHLTYPDYAGEGTDGLIARAVDAGVEHILCVAYDAPSCRDVVRLARREPRVSAVVGVHPHEADRVTPGDLEEVEEIARDDEIVGIGELGLDYYRDYADHDNQKRLFHTGLEMAARLKKPVVIHDREAHDDVFAILEEHVGDLVGGVMHCFSGDRSFMDKVIGLGFYISIPGPVTFSRKGGGRLEDVVRACPEERLLIETDCPWLAPVPFRGKRNEPAYVRFVLEKIAEIRGADIEELDKVTTRNTKRLFIPGGDQVER